MSCEYKTLDLPLIYSGKVRDIYDFDKNYLIVTSDRISAFDHIIPTIIPDKGKVLHKLSMFWFDFVRDIIPNHVINGNFDDFPVILKRYKCLKDRSMIAKKANKINIECIVRGYLAGSGWDEYKKNRTICGIILPDGLKKSSKLLYPIFTPSSKEGYGKHDENISFNEAAKVVGKNVIKKLKEISLCLYKKVSEYSFSKGIIIADTKFEFGFFNKKLILIDEIFTPDSSRFWEIDRYEEGKFQDSLDKQYVRDYLNNVKWDKFSSAPHLPDDIVKKTFKKYIDVYERLTGRSL
ncbi:MAG: phosphoribosylaminoimidazolesuccinocarboxamide synthase [Endomicrobium sp.]|jgi:phosphoribosylaminoimidazole-succinocarboxamide synthase|nr:phosphoribosylaminoimidazolesuccinocarboxamide synthase [Endomicrobium sp.]